MRRMPLSIPFRDVAATVAPGSVAFLKLESDAQGLRGGILVTTALGEPLEFAFSRIDVHASVLWRAGDAHRSAVVQLARVLFPALATRPDCLAMLAEEVPARLFLDEIRLELPACRVGGSGAIHALDEMDEPIDDTLHLYWIGHPPSSDDPARMLIDSLRDRELLVEPFDRASLGLREALGDSPNVVA